MKADKNFWSGELCFGLVNIPFALGVSRKSHDHVFKQYVDNEEKDPVGRAMTNKGTGDVLPYGTGILRGIEVPGYGFVYLTKDELDSVAPEANHQIKIESFFRLNAFDFNRFDTTYNMIPDSDEPNHIKAYNLLRDSLEIQHKGAFVKIRLRHREQLALVHVSQGGMVLSTLYYEDEIIKVPPTGKSDTTEAERLAAFSLINSMTVKDYEYSNEQDTYWHAVTNLIVDKAQ